MPEKSTIFVATLASVLGGAITLGGYLAFLAPAVPVANPAPVISNPNVQFTSAPGQLANAKYVVPEGLNFLEAAHRSTPAVVHIKTSYGRSAQTELLDLLRNEDDDQRSLGSGSGVIIAPDGYIITNQHVIDNAEVINVVLDDKRAFPGTIIGEDPTTDLALIKIQEEGLPFLAFGNSDQVQVGEWVLAVGNPFDLTSTVTAGIVSAKARNIQILRNTDGLAVEAFIQTDAAVNPGNSGGALVNLRGELVGINTAIATRTGGYAGYSFAVPATLAKKVAEDLLKHGEVQRALLGVGIREVDAEVAKEHNMSTVRGVLIQSVSQGSGAYDAGMEIGDVILSINGVAVNTVAALQEMVARHRPGEKIEAKVSRKGEEQMVKIVLKNRQNTLGVVNTVETVSALGADFTEISEPEKRKLDVEAGVKVSRLREGKLKEQKVPLGFVITHIDKKPVRNLNDLKQQLDGKKGRILIEGLDQNGEKAFFGIGF
ncbi:MAG: trypsin-like peptidase domain-containing protein [Bernardetiaceae bacterium]|jgi:Do/DeqQ family serine protease|nr:trypsin-like peptidase domain-containing protein [Bernardetiaceae bacterium]